MPPKSAAEKNRETRDRKRAAGLVWFTMWLTPEERDAVRELIQKMREAKP